MTGCAHGVPLRSLLAAVSAAMVVVAGGCGSPETPPTAPTATVNPSAADVPDNPSPDKPVDHAAADGFPHQPLWPFVDAQQALRWQVESGPQGHQPWHADAELTALAFTQGFLGFSGIDRITSCTGDGDEAWVGVGSTLPNGEESLAAVVHLVRFGSGRDAPWEVVGTRDGTLVLDTPHYGSQVRSPITAGGTITGVDESLRLQVRQVGRDDVLGEHFPLAAGGEAQRWSAQVAYNGAGSGALTLVVSTGGHVADVERFAITGLRVGRP
jgi:hypothetical protein